MSETKALVSVVTHESDVVVVDSATGEVVDTSSKKTIKYMPGATYLKTFHKNPMFHRQMPHAARTLLFAMAASTSYGSAQSNYVFLSGKNREVIKEEYGISESSLKQALSWLIENDYVRKKSKGIYSVNPYLYARGQSTAILQRQKEWDGAPSDENPS